MRNERFGSSVLDVVLREGVEQIMDQYASNIIEQENKFLIEICEKCLGRKIRFEEDMEHFQIVQHSEFSNQYGIRFLGDDMGVVARIVEDKSMEDMWDENETRTLPKIEIVFIPGPIEFKPRS